MFKAFKMFNLTFNKLNKRLVSNIPTIFALTSGLNQRCAVAVIRLSGSRSYEVLSALTQNDHNKQLEPRKMYFKDLYNPISKEKIDKSLVVWFKAPKSFTGEDVCEFHIHGGPSIIAALLNTLGNIKGLREAEPGEFSKRAFLNGKMDLVEVEGLVDLINAETEMQRKQALSQMEGSLSKLYSKWRNTIIKALANVEAFIDFHEEENIEEDILERVERKINELKSSINLHLNDDRKGERLRNGVHVTIVGEPNSGKSSLLNSICQRQAAIVSPIPGTTRDVVESALNVSGYPILLSDTAGIRETTDEIEIEGVKRALERIELSDIMVVVIDANKYLNEIKALGFGEFIEKHLNYLLNNNTENYLKHKKLLITFNKVDLIQLDFLNNEVNRYLSRGDVKYKNICKISCTDGSYGIKDLLACLKTQLSTLCSSSMHEMPLLTQQRHRVHLTNCISHLDKYLENVNIDDEYKDIVIAAEELRSAAKCIGKITGHVTNEQILDVIFRDFCIGK